jgi:putative transposase
VTAAALMLYPVIYFGAWWSRLKAVPMCATGRPHRCGCARGRIKHVLGIHVLEIRVQTSEGAVLGRGGPPEQPRIKDVLIICCDGLTGFPQVIGAT